ncbi:MAG: hypothetical protein U5J98_06640 [Halobacteriales archaeon]|nr:hypothetical protein [Halobacteriales archaeon]
MHRISRLRDDGTERLRIALRGTSRYDLVLAAIPSAFLVAALLGVTLDVGRIAAVGAAAAFSALAVLDALFLHPPRRPSGGRRAA